MWRERDCARFQPSNWGPFGALVMDVVGRSRRDEVPRTVRVWWLIRAATIGSLWCSAITAASGAEFDFAALRTVLDQRQVHSVEQLIPLLPAALRSRYTLLFASRSLQRASYGAPRAILYGSDAHLVLTFNGDPDQRGFYSVETLEFGPDKQFRLREIRFPSAGSTEAVTFSETNPATCLACHGSPARPVWDSWPLWPGAYGERYDTPLSAQERAGLKRFLERQRSDPRYEHLLGITRLADPATFHSTHSKRYAGVLEEPPNAEFGALLGGLAAQSIVQELRGQPGFADYQYALLGMAEDDCGSVADFLPAAAGRAALVGQRRLADVSAIANRWAVTLKEQRLSGHPATGTRAESLTLIPSGAALVPLRLIAEAGLAVNTDRWTLALEKGTYDFTASPGSRPTLRDVLLAEVAAEDQTLSALSSYATSADGDRYCHYLQRRSQAALSSKAVAASVDWTLASRTPPSHVTDRPSAGLHPQEVLRICAGCHDSGVAPHIPFLQESKLKQALLSEVKPRARLLDEVLFRLSPAAADGRMPLGISLSDEEREELGRYFLTLTAQLR